MNSLKPHKFVLLTILDGWGIAAPSAGNAIAMANTVNANKFWASYPHTQLQASGEAVGLPRGEVGNTETGHLNLGAGRIVYQDLARINMSIADGSFFQNPTLIEAINHAKKNNSKLHIMGLMGAGGVHSNLEHLFALIGLCKKESFANVFLHLFSDGRDSPPTAAKTYISKIQEVIKRDGLGQIASLMGRYWAMDRDFRWERTEKAYLALTKGVGTLVKTPAEAIEASYNEGKTDEFIEPVLISNAEGKPTAVIGENDAVIFFNFRVDRPRQLSRSFVCPDFVKAGITEGSFDPFLVKYQKSHLASHISAPIGEPFKRGPSLNNLFFVMMTEYEKRLVDMGAHVAFPPEKVEAPLGRIVSEAGFKQLRAAESEKERFVTFYFNGQQEIAFEGEERMIIPSPKVATYDLAPEMSARELTDKLLQKLKEDSGIKLIVLNYANADMVAHTGNIGAAVKACQVLDDCLAKLYNWVLAYDGAMIITADHGNAEEMIDSQTGQIETEHSGNPVPFVVIAKEYVGRPQILVSGALADVAPTILALLGLEAPSSMTGRNLLSGFE